MVYVFALVSFYSRWGADRGSYSWKYETAITAAVVGVILNLALFFAYHVLWPQGFEGAFDIFSAVLTVLAAVALLVFKRSVLTVIGASALIGLIFSFVVTLF